MDFISASLFLLYLKFVMKKNNWNADFKKQNRYKYFETGAPLNKNKNFPGSYKKENVLLLQSPAILLLDLLRISLQQPRTYIKDDFINLCFILVID